MKRKKRTKTGSSLRLLLLLLAVLLPGGLCPAKDKKTNESVAVIAGTVFRDPGFALPGAEITLEPVDKEQARKAKVKRLQLVSNSRGEFAFRVPVTPLRYTVSVRASGFQPQEKPAEIQGEQRVDLYFSLLPAASKP